MAREAAALLQEARLDCGREPAAILQETRLFLGSTAREIEHPSLPPHGDFPLF